MIPRRTPLVRKTPLRQVSERRAAKAGKPHPKPKSTGPDRATRELVLERDDYRCVSCGLPIMGQQYSLQHRKARGVGGDNTPANLIVLCGSATSPGGCHLAAEQRGAQSLDLGYWVPSWQHPADVPVMHFVHGRVWLTDTGEVSYSPPGLEGDFPCPKP